MPSGFAPLEIQPFKRYGVLQGGDGAGIGLKIAGTAGPFMMLLMWAAQLPPATNPLIDNHIIFALLLMLFPVVKAGHTLGLGAWWAEKTRTAPILQ